MSLGIIRVLCAPNEVILVASELIVSFALFKQYFVLNFSQRRYMIVGVLRRAKIKGK